MLQHSFFELTSAVAAAVLINTPKPKEMSEDEIDAFFDATRSYQLEAA